MARMFPEVYEALRSTGMAEDKAVRGAVRLTEAVLATGSGRTSHIAEREAERAATIMPDLAEVSSGLRHIHNSLRVQTWMLAVTLLLTFIVCLEVYSHH
jgi:uncharacterized membrane protein